MASVTDAQIEEIRAQISELDSAVFSVTSVTVEQDDDPHGPATRVTVGLHSRPVSDDERVDAMVRFSRAARRIAYDVLGDEGQVRVAYAVSAEGAADDGDADETVPDRADKTA